MGSVSASEPEHALPHWLDRLFPLQEKGEDRRIDSVFGLSTRKLNRSISGTAIQSAGDHRKGGRKKRKERIMNLVPCLQLWQGRTKEMMQQSAGCITRGAESCLHRAGEQHSESMDLLLVLVPTPATLTLGILSITCGTLQGSRD